MNCCSNITTFTGGCSNTNIEVKSIKFYKDEIKGDWNFKGKKGNDFTFENIYNGETMTFVFDKKVEFEYGKYLIDIIRG